MNSEHDGYSLPSVLGILTIRFGWDRNEMIIISLTHELSMHCFHCFDQFEILLFEIGERCTVNWWSMYLNISSAIYPIVHWKDRKYSSHRNRNRDAWEAVQWRSFLLFKGVEEQSALTKNSRPRNYAFSQRPNAEPIIHTMQCAYLQQCLRLVHAPITIN